LLPGQLRPQEERRLDRRVTFPVPLVAFRPVAVGRVPLELVRLVGLVRRAAVVPERLAELVHPRLAVRSAVAAAVVQAVAAAEQTRSVR
jgi:hypothetical protein